MIDHPTPDSLHRTAKALADSGDVASFAEAVGRLAALKLGIVVDPDLAISPTVQTAVLTMVNCARRCFLGGVAVSVPPEVYLAAAVGSGRSFGEAVENLGGSCGLADGCAVVIAFGTVATPPGVPVLRPTFDGWVGAVLGVASSARLAEAVENPLTGVLIGGISIAEAFQMATGTNPLAGRRDIGMSLWEPGVDWRAATPGPVIEYLPARLWLIGLGHLGQAYLWTLGALPYAHPEQVELLLQDFDRLEIANDSTSPLTDTSLVGLFKTRAMAAWCERRGFQTRLVERPFSRHLRVDGEDPRVALCGVDNAQARAELEDVGFECVIEAGLGKGWRDYLEIQIHTFPSQIIAAKRWANLTAPAQQVPQASAYASLKAAGMDDCGLLQMSGRSVGAAFVGCTAAACALAELLRHLHGGPRSALVDLTLSGGRVEAAIPVTHARNVPIPFTAAASTAERQCRCTRTVGAIRTSDGTEAR